MNKDILSYPVIWPWTEYFNHFFKKQWHHQQYMLLFENGVSLRPVFFPGYACTQVDSLVHQGAPVSGLQWQWSPTFFTTKCFSGYLVIILLNWWRHDSAWFGDIKKTCLRNSALMPQRFFCFARNTVLLRIIFSLLVMSRSWTFPCSARFKVSFAPPR